uniref:UPAR/Ly6 domain-containing protein n=1 Tax=Amphilophus citrinellus TaxID=61819 RepID=A0A3Q0QXI6_AMPCI
MRAAVCAFLLLLTLYHGEALTCNYCFSYYSDLCTPTSTQTCSIFDNACADVVFQGPVSASFRQCMNMAVCQGYITTPGVLAICCSTDLSQPHLLLFPACSPI